MYSGFLILAIVCFAPIFFAKKQESILVSSEPVTATKSSASSTRDCFKVSQSVQLPQTPIISLTFVVSSIICGLVSMAVTSCPSFTRLSIIVKPILPQPDIIIFIICYPLIFFYIIQLFACFSNLLHR